MARSMIRIVAVVCALCCLAHALPLPSTATRFGDVPEALASALLTYANEFSYTNCNLAAKFLTEDVLIYDANGDEPTDKTGWYAWCNRYAGINVTMSSGSISYNPYTKTAIWELVWNFPTNTQFYHEFTEVTVQNAETTPMISRMNRFETDSPAPAAISDAIMHNYAQQYYKNCTQYLSWFNMNATWVSPDGVMSYTQKIADCNSEWNGVTSFMFTAFQPVMYNVQTSTILVLWQFQQTMGDPATTQVQAASGRMVYMMDNNNLITLQREYFPVKVAKPRFGASKSSLRSR